MKLSRANTPVEKTRVKKGLSHGQLAKKANISRPAISHIEHGKRTPTLLLCLKIAHGLDESLCDIIAKCERKLNDYRRLPVGSSSV